MYFSMEGREDLVNVIDRLIIAKKMLNRDGSYFPENKRFYPGTGIGEDKLYFFVEALEYNLNARIDVDETTDNNVHEIHQLVIKLNELDEFKYLSRGKNQKYWEERLTTIVKNNLQEVQADSFMDAEMNAQLKDNNILHVKIESAMYSTFHNYVEAFFNFTDELKELLNEMKQEKGRKSA